MYTSQVSIGESFGSLSSEVEYSGVNSLSLLLAELRAHFVRDALEHIVYRNGTYSEHHTDDPLEPR